MLRSALTSLICLLAAGPDLGAHRPPNVVVILADDLGYGDLGCYGARQVRTPHLDRMAREGVRFTQAYAPSATSTPSRYSLLTGSYPWRHPRTQILQGDAPLLFAPGQPTLPSLLQQAGYRTAAIGKWHLGLGDGKAPLDWNGDIRPGPLEVGFDHFFGMPATGDRVPTVYMEDRRVVGLDPADPITVDYTRKVGTDPTGLERPDLLKQRWLEGHQGTIVDGISRIGFMAGGQAARWKDEDMGDTFVTHALDFLTAQRDRPFFLYLAVHEPHVPRVPHPRFQGTSAHGLRGDTIQQFDDSVGRILARLRELGLDRDTLVIVTSDNGGVMQDGYADGSESDPSGHRPNGVLRGGKYQAYEGGVRVPFLVRWPGRVPAGRTSAALLGLQDLTASLVGLAGATLPPEAASDSLDLRRTLLGGRSTRASLVLEARALRRGPWKYIWRGAQQPAELYRLDRDPGETRNLAERHPDQVRALHAELQAIRASRQTR